MELMTLIAAFFIAETAALMALTAYADGGR
jgi:hypothetical protein